MEQSGARKRHKEQQDCEATGVKVWGVEREGGGVLLVG